MEVTLSGMVSDDRLVQPPKAQRSRVLMVLGRLTVVSALQL